MLAVIALGGSEGDEIAEAFAKVLIEDPEDLWLRRAVLSGAEKRAGMILERVLADDGFRGTSAPGRGVAPSI